MAFDFPITPTDGQLYSPAGGPDYVWVAATGAWEIKTTGSNSAFVAKAGDTMSGHLGLPAGPATNQAVRRDYVDGADAAKAATSYVDTQDNLRVLKAGDAMTGALSITMSDYPYMVFRKPAMPGACSIFGAMANANRWEIVLGDGAAETGSNAGSGFAIQRYNDAGAYINTAMTIDRATGAVGFYPNGSGVSIAGAQPSLYLNKPVASGQDIQVMGMMSGKLRWSVDLGDNTAESGSNNGSNFAINNFNDAGTYMGHVLQIYRGNGAAYFINQVNATGFVSNSGGSYAINCGAAAWDGAYYTGYMAYAGGTPWGGQANEAVSMFGRNYLGFWTRLYINADSSYYCFDHANNAYKNGGGAWADLSDGRIKNVESDYTPGLEEVATLNPKIYTYKGNDTDGAPKTSMQPEAQAFSGAAPYPSSMHYQSAKTRQKFIGLIAQEAEVAFPEMVKLGAGHIDGMAVEDLRTLDTSPLIFALVNAVKQLKAINEGLTARVAALEALVT